MSPAEERSTPDEAAETRPGAPDEQAPVPPEPAPLPMLPDGTRPTPLRGRDATHRPMIARPPTEQL